MLYHLTELLHPITHTYGSHIWNVSISENNVSLDKQSKTEDLNRETFLRLPRLYLDLQCPIRLPNRRLKSSLFFPLSIRTPWHGLHQSGVRACLPKLILYRDWTFEIIIQVQETNLSSQGGSFMNSQRHFCASNQR